MVRTEWVLVRVGLGAGAPPGRSVISDGIRRNDGDDASARPPRHALIAFSDMQLTPSIAAALDPTRKGSSSG